LISSFNWAANEAKQTKISQLTRANSLPNLRKRIQFCWDGEIQNEEFRV
jgi:hypothetical protein